MFIESSINNQNKERDTEVIAGSMVLKKIEALTRRLRRAKVAKQSVGVFKPRLDIWHARTEVISHIEKYNSRIASQKNNKLLF